MNFTDHRFWLFFAAVFALWWLCRRRYQASIGLLLVSSLVFYGFHQKWLLGLLLSYCVVNWAVGCALARVPWPRLILSLGVGFNLIVLAYWKYTPLLWNTLVALLNGTCDAHLMPVSEEFAIPFGISFYAFTGVAYMVDVFRGDTPGETNFFRYTLWAVFFPHLVAGPILRPGDLLTKIQPDTLPDRPDAPGEAMWLLARGYFKKMVLADRIALAIDPYFSHVLDASTAGAWSLPYVYLYAFQIYFDFSGYTDIARGLGLLFGYRWPDNFNLPYLATSVQDFWRRWHITLSQFLRDYLYIPLGGSKGGWWRTNFNVMLTMLLGGLWHGASWSFLIWGGLHGFFLVIHRVWLRLSLRRRLLEHDGLRPAWSALSIVLTFHAVCLAWCFFRLTAWRQSVTCVQQVFLFDPARMWTGAAADPSLWILLAAYGLGVWLASRWALRVDSGDGSRAWQGFAAGTCAALLLLALVLSPGGEKPPFIYFQF